MLYTLQRRHHTPCDASGGLSQILLVLVGQPALWQERGGGPWTPLDHLAIAHMRSTPLPVQSLDAAGNTFKCPGERWKVGGWWLTSFDSSASRAMISLTRGSQNWPVEFIGSAVRLSPHACGRQLAV
mmetsp:Transcript_1675/g.4300  ORF Transcript_1675/g.4300 Transcript_1675/m.4300 type:complete len:127 (+) Transcript_1675:187-567(+)